MKNYKEYTTEDFINEAYFIEWVLRPSEEHKQFWKEVMDSFPEKESDIKTAFSVIRSLSTTSHHITQDEPDELWKRIRKSTIAQRPRIKIYRYAAVAAILLGLLPGGVWLYKSFMSAPDQIDYSQIETPAELNNKVTLFLADNTALKIEDDESTLLYNQDGNLTINSKEQVSQLVEKEGESKAVFNQVVVPYGKRTSIVFSDGTKIWLNSGSRAIYPVEFDNKKREVYIEGEVYFDVMKDHKKPFIVKTEKMEIEVLGTSFNINSYPDEAKVSVVLVSGSVSIKPHNKKAFRISPNQLLSYSKDSKESILNEVDIYDYISWKDGWLKCNSEEISSVINKLARYYNRRFEFRDTTIKDLYFSGKLDLKEDFEQVLRVFTLAAPLKFEEENEVVFISEEKTN